ncbi:hypothetical protein EIP91_000767 [Steccherinum ochraceum]|uniref:Peptidase M50 domain-containing protein n=1 Tax=Steccherinum ochraceum TaxID=92696 RepID=A0A4R0RNM5_9APHY|nr:hypothetical protein EIP91_000767 [Steccherinum ochraceum]
MERCLAPHSFLKNPSVYQPPRCHEAIDCDSTEICVRWKSDEEILRIRLSSQGRDSSSAEHEDTIIWSGPWEEVLEDVTVGIYSARYQYLPLWLPSAVSIFFDYLSTLTLSLYFFNLLPLSFLDGGQLLDALLDLLLKAKPHVPEETELGELEAGYSAQRPRTDASSLSSGLAAHKRTVLKGASYVTGGLIVISSTLGLWNSFR